MTAVPLSRVRVSDPFWRGWQETVRRVTLPIEYAQCSQTGRIENFARAARGERGTHEGYRYNDSDVYKWIEAACYLQIALGPDPAIAADVERTVDLVAAAQMPDGYINTYFQLQEPELRWRNLSMMHEMYCGGHLLEAAVAHHEATGSTKLLDVAMRFADHVDSLFGPGKRKGYCGHQEIELALLSLARAIEREHPDAAGRYRALSKWMIETRGTRPSPFEEEYADAEGMRLAPYSRQMLDRDGAYSGEYVQDHLPLRDQTEVVGHAVRAMYFFAAATEAFADSGDEAMGAALERLWENLTQRRMYVTGGIGVSRANEGFTRDYDLPNRTAYAETCASVGLIFWAQRLLEGTGDSTYADILELALYNGALAGISRSGDRFFYDNPLESHGEAHRQEWFGCACCPPNIARLIASVGRYFLAESKDAVYVNVPASCEATVRVAGAEVGIRIESDYPWNARVAIEITVPGPMAFALKVRIPGWSSDTALRMPEGFGEAEYDGHYISIHREWSGSTRIEVAFEDEPMFVVAHPAVLECRGRAALTKGPLVYCMESVDLGGQPPQAFTVDPSDAEVAPPEGGLVPLVVRGWMDRDEDSPLYRSDAETPEPEEMRVKMIPYFAWDNRSAGPMQVWLRKA